MNDVLPARAARETVLVIAAEDRAAIVVSGKDRTTWLNGLVTCELANRAPGQGAYGLLVEKKGRIQTDLFVIPSALTDVAAAAPPEPTIALAVPSALREALLGTLDHYLIMEDAEIALADLAFFVAMGPRAAELRSAAPVAALASFAGDVDLLGSGGVVFGVPRAAKDELEARLRAEAARLGGAFADDAGWEAIRIEHGLPRFGVEFDTSFYPQEAALEKLAVSFAKGCYLGQEVVYMLENRGHVKRKLVPLDIEGGTAPAAGSPVTTPAGEAVGEIKSAVTGPLSGTPVAIAMVKWAHAKPATELRVGAHVARVRS